MKLYGMDQTQLHSALDTANEKYKGNIQFKECKTVGIRKPYMHFTLRVKDSHGKGAKRGQSGIRTVAACWHAHRDVMKEIFSINPKARLISAMAVYEGIEGFNREFEDTGDRNIGSMVNPQYFRQACEC